MEPGKLAVPNNTSILSREWLLLCYAKENSEGVITLKGQHGHHKATKKEKGVTNVRVISSAFKK